MKRRFLLLSTLIISELTFSQTIYTGDGTLSADRTVSLNKLSLNFDGTGGNMFIDGGDGNVGIGTTTPIAKMDIAGNVPDGVTFATLAEKFDLSIMLNAGSLAGSSANYRLLRFFDFPESNYNTYSTAWLGIEDRDNVGRYRFAAETGNATQMVIMDKVQSEVMTLFDDGNDKTTLVLPKTDSFVGIGTSTFVDGTDVYHLSVKGAIRADRVKVYTSWADFVFEDNYDLATLQEVEKHIHDKGHLKDIPSAKEVEQNGIELGEMNKKLLQKVEELTLYIIQMNKELQEVRSQLNKK